MMKLAAVVGGALLAFAAAAVLAVTVLAQSSGDSSPAVHHAALIQAPATPAASSPRIPIPQTRISILSSNVPVSGGVARVRLSCVMGEAIRLTCRGVLSLHAAAGALLGSTRFAIPNCCSAPWHVVGVHLGRGARSLPLRARAQAVLDRGAASSTRAVRLVSSG